jgi:ribosomal protein S2
MKIKRILNYPNKLIKLKLIKTKIYKKNNKCFIKLEGIISKIKKALQIVYKYHLAGKRILFLGTPLNSKFNYLTKSTNHIFMPKTVWMNGILTNQSSCFKYMSKNQKTRNSNTSTILFKTKKKIDLIVVLDFTSNKNAVQEGYLHRVPLIILNLDDGINYGYNIPGNFKFVNKKVRDNFFYSLLCSTLKRASTKQLRLI